MSTNDTTPVPQTPTNGQSAAEVCFCITLILGAVLLLAGVGVLLAAMDPQTKAIATAAKTPSAFLGIAGLLLFFVSAIGAKSAERFRRKIEDLESILKSKESSLTWAYGEVNRLKGGTVGTPDAPPTPLSPKEQLVRLIEERREKREAVLLSELEPYLKEAHLEQIDEEYTPKIDALYATV
jgi:hypothetical protein